MELFVPGRICLLGEHSDWAGSYRRINADLEKGYAIVTGTNQGIYAAVEPLSNKIEYTGCLNDGTRTETLELPLQSDELLARAQEGGFFSYIAGVAYQVMTHYRVRGLKIDNYRTDLPIKKGLSSSAALCVLVARAFNRIYDLKMTIRGEMEMAYRGEITTPSRCGRLDQACAYGSRPVLMEFDGDRIDVTELTVPKPLHFVIVDLHAEKDTKKILADLNTCYPFAENEQQQNVQHYLGNINKDITHQGVTHLTRADAEQLGTVMNQAQQAFDSHLQPVSPTQLTAPVLHRILSYKAIQPYIYGGKGVGSQGDGTAQLLAKDEAAQQEVIGILESECDVSCLGLTISTARKVRKAVIPAAGFGTRLFPASKAMKKELFPIIDATGRAKPVILAIVEEALSAGIEEICIIVQKEDKELFEDFFVTPPSIENFNKLSKENKKYMEYLSSIAGRITFVCQDAQEGFGHAVYCAKEWVAGEPFLLLLGDHLYCSHTEGSCAVQLIDVYKKTGMSVLGLQETPGAQIHKHGCAGGDFTEDGRILSITEFVEKPDLEYAREHLAVDGVSEDHYLTVFGQYVLEPDIFTYLEENISNNVRRSGEFQLTDCLDMLRREKGFAGYLVNGTRFDTGNPDAYQTALNEFRGAPVPLKEPSR
jgi:UTP-glucose-1-phosphate uridylyltransferase/mevalonate kinase